LIDREVPLRRFLALLFGLGLLGDIIAMLIAPGMIRYWFESPVAGASMATLNPGKVLDFGMQQLIKYQIGGTAIGMAVGIFIWILLWRRGRRKAAAAAASAPAPASAAGAEARPPA
jgi:hypothetical protein